MRWTLWDVITSRTIWSFSCKGICLDFNRIVRTMEKVTAMIPFGKVENYVRQAPGPYVPRQVTVHKDTHQIHVMIGGRGYSAYDERRTGLYLLNNILGGPGMNSRLNVALREKRGLVYNVESNLTAYTDTGTFCIYFGCDPEDADRCIELVQRELRKLREQPTWRNVSCITSITKTKKKCSAASKPLPPDNCKTSQTKCFRKIISLL